MQKWTSWLTIKIWSTIVILVELNKSTIIFNKNLRAFWSLQQELNEILKNQESCGIEELWRFRVKFGIIGTWYRGVWQLAPAAAVKHLARKMNKFWESSTFLYNLNHPEWKEALCQLLHKIGHCTHFCSMCSY